MSLTQPAELNKARHVDQEPDASIFRLTEGGEAVLELQHLRDRVNRLLLSARQWDVVPARRWQPEGGEHYQPTEEEGWAIDPNDGCGYLWTPNRAEAERIAALHNELVGKVDELTFWRTDPRVAPSPGAEDALDRVLRRAGEPGIASDDLVQAVVELLDEAALSPAQSDRVDRSRKQALERWSLGRRAV